MEWWRILLGFCSCGWGKEGSGEGEEEAAAGGGGGGVVTNAITSPDGRLGLPGQASKKIAADLL
jgi:hypothetical protein